MENTNKYTGLPYPQTFTGMYILLDPTNGNVEGISSSPMNTENEIWVSKEEYGEDYMWLSNMRRVDGHWVEKPKMKTIWRKADGSSGTVEADFPIGEEWTEVECPSGMRKPVWYEGEWVEHDVKALKEENKKLRQKLEVDNVSINQRVLMNEEVLLMILDEKYAEEGDS